MPDILRQIEAYKRRGDLRGEGAHALQNAGAAGARARSAASGFLRAIERQHSQGRIALIAEIEEGEPVEGSDPCRFRSGKTRQGLRAGRRDLSVCPDRRPRSRARSPISASRKAAVMPALRKDFMLDPYQVYEARANGAGLHSHHHGER